MVRSIRHRGLKRLYEGGDIGGVGARHAKRIALALADLDAAGKPSDLDLPGYRLHPLKGDRRGFWSLSISANWRMYDVDLIDYH